MRFIRGAILLVFPLVALIFVVPFAALSAQAQSGNAGSVRGTVTDPPAPSFPTPRSISQTRSADSNRPQPRRTGQFTFTNVPFNPYRISVSAKGFATLSQNVEIRSSVGTTSSWFCRLPAAARPSQSSLRRPD